MSVRHSGLVHKGSWVERAQAQGDLELLDSGFHITEIDLRPAVPCTCHRQVWIETYGPREQRSTLFNLTDDEAKDLSSHRKHPWIVFTEFKRPAHKPSSFLNLSSGIDTPAKGFPSGKGRSAKRVGGGKFRIEFISNLGELERFKVGFPSELVIGSKSAEIVIVCLKALGRLAPGPLYFRLLQLRRNCADPLAAIRSCRSKISSSWLSNLSAHR